jgi:hypothetical protein
LPVAKQVGRNGLEVGIGLSYNSQNWRKDGSAVWKLGDNVGYGFGWRLSAGTITPYWQDYQTIHHFVYTDATGAEYRLDVNTNGIWTSKEGFYGRWDHYTQRLHLPNGTTWDF